MAASRLKLSLSPRSLFLVYAQLFDGKLPATCRPPFNYTMSTISTHILDLSRGAPAGGVAVHLDFQNTDESWTELSHAWTDDDGRVKPFFLVSEQLAGGTYRLVFDTEHYFSELNVEFFYPQVTVVFKIDDAAQHFHVPLLISPYGYSTYRGS